jgi:hypothetical protein
MLSPPRKKSSRPRVRTVCTLVCLISCLALCASAEENPTLTFTLDFPGSEPSHYRISISSDGHATYDSDGKLTAESEDDPFHLDFSLSESTRTRAFDLAKRANYFQGEIDSRKRNLASTGTKTLAYKDAEHNTQATYNYSPIPAVEQLTQLLQNLSTTLEFGHRLQYYHRYQKLALDEQLKRMEEMSKQNTLGELQAIAPILQQIVNDNSLITPVRVRAQRLLAEAGNAPSR